MRSAAVLGSTIVFLVATGCGDGSGEPSPIAQPGSLVILTGDGQTDTAGATFAVPVRAEVRDEAGSPLADVLVWFGEERDGEFASDFQDTTDAAGQAEVAWRPDGLAGVHRFRAAVFLEGATQVHLVAADTISGTVVPASVYSVDLSGPTTRFLGETLDMNTLVGQATDRYTNPVTVTSLTVEAAPPFEVNGTVVHSDVEVDDVVTLRINGVPFGYRLTARRDLRELVGAQGGWVCDKVPGAPTATPGLYYRRREGQVTVDSVKLHDGGEIWTFFLSTSWHDQFSNGTTSDGAEQQSRMVIGQSPAAWSWEYGPTMVQASTAPLSYVATSAPECLAWDTIEGEPPAHELLHLSK